jgi:hypothetical protein
MTTRLRPRIAALRELELLTDLSGLEKGKVSGRDLPVAVPRSVFEWTEAPSNLESLSHTAAPP